MRRKRSYGNSSFEFYDYQEDIDARHNRIDDPELRETIEAYRTIMLELMRDTNDPQLKHLQTAASGMATMKDADSDLGKPPR